MKYKKFFLMAWLAILFVSACTYKSQSAGDAVIASVAGTQLLLEDALAEIPAFVFEQDSADAVQAYARQWIRTQVSIRHAEQKNVHQTQKFKDKLDRFYNQILESQLKEFILEQHHEELEVTSEEAQNYYQAHKERFILDENYIQFRHLTTQTRTEADNANREIVQGEEWEDVVRKYSVAPERQLRQSAMYWPQSLALSEIPVLNEYLSVMGITERSPIHFHNGEYHFVQLTDIKTEGESPELEWLIPQIREWLVLEKSRRIVNAYVRNLYLEAEANNEIELTNVSDIETLLSDKYGNQ